MNARLNMKDINKISANEHFKCIFLMIRRTGTILGIHCVILETFSIHCVIL